MGRRLIAVAAVAAGFLSLGTTAASADPYWFWQGTLPMSDGTREVFRYTYCCGNNWIRMSYDVQPPAYDHCMNFVTIRRSTGGWNSWQSCEHDNVAGFDYYYISYEGCQNPLGLWPAWTNCHNGLSY